LRTSNNKSNQAQILPDKRTNGKYSYKGSWKGQILATQFFPWCYESKHQGGLLEYYDVHLLEQCDDHKPSSVRGFSNILSRD